MIKHLGRTYGAQLLCVQAADWVATSASQDLATIEPGFDCFIVNRGAFRDSDADLLTTIALRAGEWIEVLGDRAEEIHDALDAASVRVGRQRAVGDGNPMTTWQEGISDSEIASYIWTGGQGSGDRKVILVVADPTVAERVMRELAKASGQA